MCVASEDQAQWFQDRGVKPHKDLCQIGYLQLDPVFRGDVAPTDLGTPPGMPVILYAPTHGEEISSIPMLGDDPVQALSPNHGDAYLVIKPHPETLQRHPERIDRLRVSAALHENVLLVTNCSSVMLIFLAYDKPLVLLNNPKRLEDTRRYDPDGPE